MTTLFDQPEFYNSFDNPDRMNQGGWVVTLIGGDGNTKLSDDNPIPTSSGGGGQSQIVSSTTDLDGTVQEVAFDPPLSKFTLFVDSDATGNTYINAFDGEDPTTDNFGIPPGAGITYDGPPVTGFKLQGGNTGTFSIFGR
jgi:hypothetical protein